MFDCRSHFDSDFVVLNCANTETIPKGTNSKIMTFTNLERFFQTGYLRDESWLLISSVFIIIRLMSTQLISCPDVLF